MEPSIDLFNEKVCEFIEYLTTLTNDDYIINKLNKNKSKLNIALYVNNNYALELIEDNLLKYKEDIFNHNCEILKTIENTLFDSKIKISEIYLTLSESEQENIWKYLKIFLLICEQI